MRLKTISTLTLAFCFAAVLFLAASAWNSAYAASSGFQSKQAAQLNSQSAGKGAVIEQLLSDEFEAALVSVASLRLVYDEHLGVYGQSPDSINELGLSEHDFQNELVEHVGISSATGAILIGLDDQFGDKQWAALIPIIEQYHVTGWRCQTTLSPSSVGNADCKPDVAYSQVDREFDPSLLSSAFGVLNLLKLQYKEFYENTGIVPTSMEQLDANTSLLKSGNISHLIVDSNTKTMVAGLDNDIFGTNQWISLTPIPHYRYNYIFYWKCRTTLSSEIMAVAGLIGCEADQGIEDLL